MKQAAADRTADIAASTLAYSNGRASLLPMCERGLVSVNVNLKLPRQAHFRLTEMAGLRQPLQVHPAISALLPRRIGRW